MICNQITNPKFTKEQIAECQGCRWASGSKKWCGRFGCWIKESQNNLFITPKELILPGVEGKEKRKRTCCGQAGSIAEGFYNLARGIKLKNTDRNIEICKRCENNTFMGQFEYDAWLLKNGIKILRNFSQLEKLEMLPKFEQSKERNKMFCRICKCYIEAKARASRSDCSLNRWEK
jgi:hypothetical protein